MLSVKTDSKVGRFLINFHLNVGELCPGLAWENSPRLSEEELSSLSVGHPLSQVSILQNFFMANRLRWKGLPGTNTLAYYENLYITAVKSFIVEAPDKNSNRWVGLFL